jgi:hypothetical protein
MTAALWVGGAIVALIAGSVAVAHERERVARKNYKGAQQLVRTTRAAWFRALWIAARATLLAAIGLGIAWLISGGRQR